MLVSETIDKTIINAPHTSPTIPNAHAQSINKNFIIRNAFEIEISGITNELKSDIETIIKIIGEKIFASTIAEPTTIPPTIPI